MPNGKIQEDHITSLKKIGEWMDKYGELIYGSKEGPVPANDEMVSTQKDNKIYFHLIKDQELLFIRDIIKK